MGMEAEIGSLVRSVPVPPQENNPDIRVSSLDLHERGFVVRCVVRGNAKLGAPFAAVDLHDSEATAYEVVASGADFVAYRPEVPDHVAWIGIRTRPETRIDLTQVERMSKLLDGIPGLPERLEVAKDQIARGEAIPLEDL